MDHLVFRRPVRDRLGDRPQIHGWLLEAVADVRPCSMIVSLGLLGLALKTLPVGHRLCGVDGHRHRRHAAARHPVAGRAAGAIRLGCIALIVAGHHRAEAGGLSQAAIRKSLEPLQALAFPQSGRRTGFHFAWSCSRLPYQGCRQRQSLMPRRAADREAPSARRRSPAASGRPLALRAA